MIPRLIADYQPVAARAAFKAGADLILGHHAHIPKAIGVHDGKVCFYSLSNFIVSSPPTAKGEFARRYGISRDPDYPRMDYGVDAKRTLIAKAILTRDGVKKASFLPVLIDKALRPEVLSHGDARFDDAVRYMEWASEWIDHKFSVEGNEVVITAPVDS
jgi:poly-gamma-glutamate synthesis protein (capsule biosynthesis protein)